MPSSDEIIVVETWGSPKRLNSSSVTLAIRSAVRRGAFFAMAGGSGFACRRLGLGGRLGWRWGAGGESGFQVSHAGLQVGDVLQGGHAQAVQGTRHTLLEDVLQFVDATAGLLAQALGHVGKALGGLLKALLCFFLAFALKSQAVTDQGFEGLVALGLCLGHGPQPSQPDLMRVQPRQVRHAGGGSGGVGFLGHVGVRFAANAEAEGGSKIYKMLSRRTAMSFIHP